MSIFNKHAHQERPYIVIVDIDGAISEAIEDRLHLLPLPGKGALILIWTVWLVTGCCENARIKHEPGCGKNNKRSRTVRRR